MFTGLIERTGLIKDIQTIETGKKFYISILFENDDVKVGDSISINGVCLTVESLSQIENDKIYSFYASFKTLEITNLNELSVSDRVNLERAVLPITRMGGHIVQGHVDGIGWVTDVSEKDGGTVLEYKVKLSKELLRYTVTKGSIAVDGISLTIVDIIEDQIVLVIIPETIRKTNIHSWKKNTKVNIETDIMARYMDKWNHTSG